MLDLWRWLNSNAGAIQAISSILSFFALTASVIVTVTLARYTRQYVGLTQDLLAQQERDYRRRVDEALRALLVELGNNNDLVFDMINSQSIFREPSPGLMAARKLQERLRRSTWEMQLPLIAGFLQSEAVETVAQAYRNIDALISDLQATVNIDVLRATRDVLSRAITAVRRATDLPERPRS